MRSARKRLDLSQGFLAPLLGLSRDQLNSVELGRVALRFDPGLTFCGELDLNPLWLAFGESPPAGFVFVEASDFADDDLFSEAVTHLRPRYETSRAEAAKRTGKREPLAATREQIAKWLPQVPAEQLDQFWREIDRAAREFVARQKSNVKAYLTSERAALNVPSMTWADLKRRIALATTKRGLKSKLASDVGVSRQVVSAWMSGAGKPNADTVLFLLEWVAAEEAKQQKRAGRAETRPAQSTRKSKSTSHEKAKSDRKKK